MNAIPTKYAGVQFRSRLEARWAAFFDLIQWTWEYEPIDLKGYIPDFILDGEYLVEVKPISKWPCPVIGCRECDDTPRDQYDAAVAKIEHGWSGRHALIVGASIFKANIDIGDYPVPCLGRVVSSDLWLRGAGFDFMRPGLLVEEWREAANRVQWRAPR